MAESAVEKKEWTPELKAQRVKLFSESLVQRNMPSTLALAVASTLAEKSLSESEFDTLIQLAEKTSLSYVGVTSKDGSPKHNHDFAVIVLSNGYVVGTTTSSPSDNVHSHLIKVACDYRIVSMEARSNWATYAPVEKSATEPVQTDIHSHNFKVNVENVLKEAGSAYISLYLNEDGTVKKEEAVPEKVEPVAYLNERQAELALIRACSYADSETQARVFSDVLAKYPNVDMNESVVAETAIHLAAAGKTDPKAAVRNRPDPVFPASSKYVKDKKDHFPIGNAAQARNALARAAQYDSVPAWFTGSLSTLQKMVRDAVKRKYPSISVTMNAYSLMFRQGEHVYYRTLATENVDAAKHDATLYFNDAPADCVTNLVQIKVDDAGVRVFTDLGVISLIDRAKGWRFSSAEDSAIQLSDKDQNGNTVIEILREGSFNHAQYGTFAVTKSLIDEVIRNFNADVIKREVAVDMNHITGLPAAAWFKRLSKKTKVIDGKTRTVLLGHVKFTPRGEEAIKNEEFKYFSSEYVENFTDKETGKSYGAVLRGGGLTNRPWMPGLAPIKLSEIESKYALVLNQ